MKPLNIPLDILFDVKPILLQKMLTRLDYTSNVSYTHTPSGKNEEEKLQAIKHFIDHNLDEFLLLSQDLFKSYTHEDKNSIGTEDLTDNAKKFFYLINFLQTNHFTIPDNFGKKINLWSGKEGRLKAISQPNEQASSNSPLIMFMYDFSWSLQQLKYTEISYLISSSISRYYVCGAKESINVYISSDKQSEKPGLTIFNHFWSDEIPILLDKHKKNIINDINIYLYCHELKIWKEPISYFSPAFSDLVIRRRKSYPFDDKERFVADFMSEEETSAWSMTSPRPHITVGALKCIVRTWYERAKITKPLLTPILNVIFDVGGVLLTFDKRKVIKDAFPDIDFDLVLRNTLRSPDWVEFDCGNITEEELASNIANNLACTIDQANYFFDSIKSSWEPINKMISLLYHLHSKGYKIYGLTNMPASIQNHFYKQFDFWKLFEKVIVSSDVHLLKPNSDIYVHLLKTTAINPSESIFVDDRIENIETAKNLGFFTVHYKSYDTCYQDINSLMNPQNDHQAINKPMF